MYRNIFCCLSLFLLCARVGAQNFDIEHLVEECLSAFNVPGVAVGVIQNGEVKLAKGFGMRNIETKDPVTENTCFPIASCTKAFTATLLAQLVDEGYLEWDDPVIKHVPDFKLFSEYLTRKVTIKDILAHRTGIPRHDAVWCCHPELTSDSVLQKLVHFQPLCELREAFHYNNFIFLN